VQNGASVGEIFVDMMEAAGVNQVAPFIDVELDEGQAVTLNYRPLVADAVPWGQGSYFQLTQLPTATTVPAGSIVPTPLQHAAVAVRSANFAIPGINTDVLFNTLSTGTLPYNAATGVFTLTAGQTYELQASLKTRATTAGYVQYEWVDAITNAAIAGATVGIDVHATTGLAEGNGGRAYVPSYTPVSTQTVKVRVTGTSGAGLVADADRSYAVVRQLVDSVVVDAGTVPVTALASGQVLSIRL